MNKSTWSLCAKLECGISFLFNNLSSLFDGELTYASLVDALDLVLFFLNGSRRLLRKLSIDNDISMLGDNRIA